MLTMAMDALISVLHIGHLTKIDLQTLKLVCIHQSPGLSEPQVPSN